MKDNSYLVNKLERIAKSLADLSKRVDGMTDKEQFFLDKLMDSNMYTLSLLYGQADRDFVVSRIAGRIMNNRELDAMLACTERISVAEVKAKLVEGGLIWTGETMRDLRHLKNNPEGQECQKNFGELASAKIF